MQDDPVSSRYRSETIGVKLDVGRIQGYDFGLNLAVQTLKLTVLSQIPARLCDPGTRINAQGLIGQCYSLAQRVRC